MTSSFINIITGDIKDLKEVSKAATVYGVRAVYGRPTAVFEAMTLCVVLAYQTPVLYQTLFAERLACN